MNYVRKYVGIKGQSRPKFTHIEAQRSQNMGHRTTVVELVIEPSDLSAIIQEWVEEEKFSVYEKGETRTIYSKMKGLSTAWLSVENNGKKTRIEAWLSQKGVGADFVGNAWVGWKVAVRKRSVLGGVRAYRKQFEQLLQGLQAKSESMVEREVASLDQNHSQPVIKKSVLVTGLVILGALSFVGGLSGVINARGIVRSLMPDFAETLLVNSAFDTLFGALVLASSLILARGKALGVWLYAGAILLDIVFNFAIGNKLNYFFVGLSLLFMWQIVKLKNQWELA